MLLGLIKVGGTNVGSFRGYSAVDEHTITNLSANFALRISDIGRLQVYTIGSGDQSINRRIGMVGTWAIGESIRVVRIATGSNNANLSITPQSPNTIQRPDGTLASFNDPFIFGNRSSNTVSAFTITYFGGNKYVITDVSEFFNPAPTPTPSSHELAYFGAIDAPSGGGQPAWGTLTLPITTSDVQNAEYSFQTNIEVDNGQYFYILIPDNRVPTSIRGPVGESLSLFDTASDVRTIGSQDYNVYYKRNQSGVDNVDFQFTVSRTT